MISHKLTVLKYPRPPWELSRADSLSVFSRFVRASFARHRQEHDCFFTGRGGEGGGERPSATAKSIAASRFFVATVVSSAKQL